MVDGWVDGEVAVRGGMTRGKKECSGGRGKEGAGYSNLDCLI